MNVQQVLPGVSRRGNLEAQLTGIAEGGGRNAAAAQAALDEIAENRGQIAALQAERANRQAFTSATPQAAKAVRAGTKAKQAAKTVAKRLTTIAAKGGAFVKAGVRTALGALSIVDPLLLPGPLDAIALMAGVALSYGAAWDIIKRENTQSGFAAGSHPVCSDFHLTRFVKSLIDVQPADPRVRRLQVQWEWPKAHSIGLWAKDINLEIISRARGEMHCWN